MSRWPELWNLGIVTSTLAVLGPFLLPYSCMSAGGVTSGLVGVSSHGTPLSGDVASFTREGPEGQTEKSEY